MPHITEQVGIYLLRRYIFVHLSKAEKNVGMYNENASIDSVNGNLDEDDETKVPRGADATNVDDRSDETVGQQKFDLLILMLRKLYAFVTGIF